MTDVADLAAPFWDALAEGELRLPECSACGTVAFPPGPVCPDCGSDDLAWRAVDPTGTLYSFTRQHRTPPGFESPTVMGLVELDAGPRLLVPIDADYESLSIGDRLRLEAFDYEANYDRGRRSDDPFFRAVPADSTN